MNLPTALLVALLAAGCASTTDPAAAPSDGTAKASAPDAHASSPAQGAPTQASTAPEANSQTAPELALRFERVESPAASAAVLGVDWASALRAPSPGARLSWASAGSAELELDPAALDPRFRTWIKLDHHAPRALSGSKTRLDSLWFELEGPAAGEHVLTLFPSDEQGRLFTNAAGEFVFAERRFFLDAATPNPASTSADSGSAPGPRGSSTPSVWVFSPAGTLNGTAQADAPRLQLWAAEPAPVAIRVRGPRGAQLSTSLARGAYAVAGLESGDYEVLAGSPGGSGHALFTVNRDLEPAPFPFEGQSGGSR